MGNSQSETDTQQPGGGTSNNNISRTNPTRIQRSTSVRQEGMGMGGVGRSPPAQTTSSASYPPENEPIPEPWPLGLFSSLSIRPSNPSNLSGTRSSSSSASSSYPSSSTSASDVYSSSSSSCSSPLLPPHTSTSFPSSSSSSSSSRSSSSNTRRSPGSGKRRQRPNSTMSVLGQPPLSESTSWRRIGRDDEDDDSEDEVVSDEDDGFDLDHDADDTSARRLSHLQSRSASSLVRGGAQAPGPHPTHFRGPPPLASAPGPALPTSYKGIPPRGGLTYPGQARAGPLPPSGRGSWGTPPPLGQGQQAPNRVHVPVRPPAGASGAVRAGRPGAQSRAVTEQQQALQAMGIPLEMVDQLLSGDGDLDEEAFNRLVLLTTALQPQQDKGVPPHILDSLQQIVFVSAEITETSEKSCVVCLEDFEEKETLIKLPQCIHAFHRQCIRSWLVEKASCPVCRTPVE